MAIFDVDEMSYTKSVVNKGLAKLLGQDSRPYGQCRRVHFYFSSKVPPTSAGILTKVVVDVLTSKGVDSLLVGGRTVSDLERCNQNGVPIITRITDPNVKAYSHFVVDGIT